MTHMCDLHPDFTPTDVIWTNTSENTFIDDKNIIYMMNNKIGTYYIFNIHYGWYEDTDTDTTVGFKNNII